MSDRLTGHVLLGVYFVMTACTEQLHALRLAALACWFVLGTALVCRQLWRGLEPSDLLVYLYALHGAAYALRYTVSGQFIYWCVLQPLMLLKVRRSL